MLDRNAPDEQRDQAALSLRNDFHDVLSDDEPELLNTYLRGRPELAHLANPESPGVQAQDHSAEVAPAQVIQPSHEPAAESGEQGHENDGTTHDAPATNLAQPPAQGPAPIAEEDPIVGPQLVTERTEPAGDRSAAARDPVATKIQDMEKAGLLEGRPDHSNQTVIVHDQAAGADLYEHEGTVLALHFDPAGDTALVHFDDGTKDGFNRTINLDHLTGVKTADVEEDGPDAGDWEIPTGSKKTDRQPMRRRPSEDDEGDDDGQGGRRRR
jgi:hypothetical protein